MEVGVDNLNAMRSFLSHLCGVEVGDGYEQVSSFFLSHLCGVEELHYYCQFN